MYFTICAPRSHSRNGTINGAGPDSDKYVAYVIHKKCNFLLVHSQKKYSLRYQKLGNYTSL